MSLEWNSKGASLLWLQALSLLLACPQGKGFPVLAAITGRWEAGVVGGVGEKELSRRQPQALG